MSQAAALAAATVPIVIGRYALFDELAAGGMATVHLGRLLGPVGFSRTVAVKRLHSHFLKDQEFITMFMDEARIVARIRHPNVVPMVDVVQGDQGLFLVMEYVHGESLSRLMRTARKTQEQIPPRIITAIMCGVLLGLHAAHETKGPDGELLGVVHRDVSPQNIIVGVDGAARVLDFGIAKAAGRAQITREGQIKGKLSYMAPEQIRGQVDRRTDVFAATVVLWELLAGRRLHEGAKDIDIVTRVVQGNFPPPSAFRPELDPTIDAIVMRGLASDPKKRFDSARDLALELERKIGLASPSEVTAWVERLGHDVLEARTNLVTAMELASADLMAAPSHPPEGITGIALAVPQPGYIPVDVEGMHVHTGEPPSSSAVFAHAQTAASPGALELGPRKLAGGAWAIIALSAFLAIVGVLLGVYALTHRSSNNASASELGLASATAPPPGVPAPPAVTAADKPAVPDKPAIAPPPDNNKPVADKPIADKPTPRAPTPLPPPGGAVVSPPARRTPAAPPAAKPSCDPAYTLDEVGHRHYKPECMGLD